jgi:lysozyme
MTTLPGIDISRIGQGDTFDWSPWHGRIAYAFVKATQGVNFQDVAYPHNIAAARALGIVCGSYHVLEPDVPGTAQADYYLAYASPQPGELVMVDVEITAGANGAPVPAAKVSACVASFCDVIKHETGAWPVTYVDQSMAQAGYVASAGQCPAFIADPSHVQLPNPIGPWRLVSFIQTGQTGVDTDTFYGDLLELQRLTTTRRYVPPAPPAPAPKLPLELMALNTGRTYAPGQPLETIWLESTDNGASYRPRTPAAAGN